MIEQSLPSNWCVVTLKDIAAAHYGLVDGPFGSSLPASAYTDTGIPVIRGSNLSVGLERFKDDEFVFVSEATANRLSRSLCKANDIIFTKKGTLGQTGIVPKHSQYETFLVSSNQMKLSVNEELADPLFVYYWVSSPESVEKLVRDAEATGVPKTNLQYLRAFPIVLPPLPEQRAIAAILGALDDKIELNRRMSKTLEEMARALFQSWFVDFDPVRAKAEGRERGLPAEIAALFPDRLVESEVGEIPGGWGIALVKDLAEFAYGKALKESDRQLGPVPVFGSNGQIGWHNAPLVKGPGIIVGRKGNPGIVTWAPTDFFCIDTTFYVVPSQDRSSLYYLYYALTQLDLGALGADSAVPGLNRNLAYMSKFLAPPPDVLAGFEKCVRSLFDRIHANDGQSRTLAALRDALLPKLIAGELRVPEAAALVETATAQHTS